MAVYLTAFLELFTFLANPHYQLLSYLTKIDNVYNAIRTLQTVFLLHSTIIFNFKHVSFDKYVFMFIQSTNGPKSMEEDITASKLNFPKSEHNTQAEPTS
jgi:hypothetical protein